MPDFHVAVFGGGSVGLCLAAHFAKAGARVTLLVRGHAVDGIVANPVTITGALGEHQIPAGQIAACDAAAPTMDVASADMLVLTTKAYDVGTALGPFSALGRCPPVLLLQNGMGSADVAREILGNATPLYSTAMMIGMVRTAPTEAMVSAQASPILCGPALDDDTGPLTQLLQLSEQGFIPMQHDPAIRETIAFKLLFNSCMNPTGALTGQTYGELLKNEDTRALIIGLADETLAAFDRGLNYCPAASGQIYVDETLNGIVFPNSHGHRSSMLQDLAAGRKTEIEFLNGAIIRMAGEHGLATPRHESIRSLIKACESSKVLKTSEPA